VPESCELAAREGILLLVRGTCGQAFVSVELERSKQRAAAAAVQTRSGCAHITSQPHSPLHPPVHHPAQAAKPVRWSVLGIHDAQEGFAKISDQMVRWVCAGFWGGPVWAAAE